MARILVSGWVLPYVLRYGGLSTFVEHVIEELRGMGHGVVYVGAAPYPRQGCWRGDGVVLCNSPVHDLAPGAVEEGWHQLAQLCASLAPTVDYAILNDVHVSPCAPVLAARGVRVLSYIHTPSGCPGEHLMLAYSAAAAANSRLVYENYLRPAVETARALHGDWYRYMAGGEPLQRVGVVYPAPPRPPEGLDLDAAAREAEKLLPREAYEAELRVLVVARGGQREKNVEGAVKAVSIIRERYNVDAVLIVAGHGQEPGVLAPGAYSLGPVEEEVKWGLYRLADVFVLPSLYEPFGLVALEAVEASTPVVLSQSSGAAEVLPGPRFDPARPEDMAEKILEAWRAGEKLAQSQARADIMKRSWRNVAEELLAMLAP